MLTNDYYNYFLDFGQQKINFRFSELYLPDDGPFYTLKKVIEELDLSGLLACYSNKGRAENTPHHAVCCHYLYKYARSEGY